jgi:hypothetical protein
VSTPRGGDRATAADPERNRRPEGVDDATVEAVGKISEALEYVHRVRGALYDLHQLIGRADSFFGDGAAMLRAAGHAELADLIDNEVVGRNLLPGRWTFQIVEEFDAGYWQRVRDFVEEVRATCVGGEQHLSEALMKRNGVTK